MKNILRCNFNKDTAGFVPIFWRLFPFWFIPLVLLRWENSLILRSILFFISICLIICLVKKNKRQAWKTIFAHPSEHKLLKGESSTKKILKYYPRPSAHNIGWPWKGVENFLWLPPYRLQVSTVCASSKNSFYYWLWYFSHTDYSSILHLTTGDSSTFLPGVFFHPSFGLHVRASR